jgi:hypothetical protein
MKRIIFASLAALTVWCSVANAQFNTLGQAPPRIRPTVSPFVNLGQGGGASAYYGIVRPQIDANRSIHDLQQGMSHLNPDGSLRGPFDQQGTNALGGLQTGHAVTYFNTGHYFPMTPGTTGSSGLSSGLGGGINAGLGTPIGIGSTGGFRTFYGSNLTQPLIRP